MAETVLVYDRDWETIKETQLDFVPAEQREQLLATIVKIAVYN